MKYLIPFIMMIAGCTSGATPNQTASPSTKTADFTAFSLIIPGDWATDISETLGYLKAPNDQVLGTINLADLSGQANFTADESYAKIVFEAGANGAMVGDTLLNGDNQDGSFTSSFRSASIGTATNGYVGEFSFKKANGSLRHGRGAVVIHTNNRLYSMIFLDTKGGSPEATINPILASFRLK